MRRVFYLSLCPFTVAGQSVHLAYPVHKSGHKTSTYGYFLKSVIIFIRELDFVQAGSSCGFLAFKFATLFAEMLSRADRVLIIKPSHNKGII